MSGLPPEIQSAIDNAGPEDDLRSREGAAAALNPCFKHCTVCEGEDHHWMPECDDAGAPLMVCKHCPAWREMRDGDLDGDDQEMES